MDRSKALAFKQTAMRGNIKSNNCIICRHRAVFLICWLCNPCLLLSFAAEAPQQSSGLWRWQEPAAWGRRFAPRPAGVSSELRGQCYDRQLPNSASPLYHRVGKLCEEHCSTVCTNSCFGDLKHFYFSKRWFVNSLKLSLWHLSFSRWNRKGLRVITESEIGLAAIYASCVKYCNPSNLTPDSGGCPDTKALNAFLFFLFW